MVGDLSTLTPAERRTLAMLAEGHTAKSIAAETGVSIHAVNERLREARRKTGAGSSRELARLLAGRDGGAAQEIGDKQLGMAAPRSGAEAGHARRPHWAARLAGDLPS